MIPRAMLAIAYATGRASHTRQVRDDDPDKKRCPGPPGWGLDVRLTTSPRKKQLRNLKEMKQDWYLGNGMKKYKKVCG